MRHGHSPNAADAGVLSDAERPLSKRGEAQTRAQAAKLAAAGGKPRLILHSPLRRAVETARSAADILNVPMESFAPLSNSMGPEDLAKTLAGPLAQSMELLIIGHQPQVGELSAWLSGQLVEFSPAAIVALEIPQAPGAKTARLLWAENP